MKKHINDFWHFLCLWLLITASCSEQISYPCWGVGALPDRPCSNVALLCNHDNKQLKENVDACVEGWVEGVQWVHDLFSCHISSGSLFCLLKYKFFCKENAIRLADFWNIVPMQKEAPEAVGEPRSSLFDQFINRLIPWYLKRFTL